MLFDYSKSGRIFSRDIGPVIRSVGLKPSEAEVKGIVAEVEQRMGELNRRPLCHNGLQILLISFVHRNFLVNRNNFYA